ncbi:FadR/GntR family transcriptional regulator [Streptomyces sp. NPDC052236]|uniref:FadR/GntR family transcriptional regulator n=1 Tax=Streptomyces sp. NPDC052236 TaxID=3365686 RepID=UPI0037CF67AD
MDVAEKLARRIFDGTHGEGDILHPRELADQLRVSQSAIHEAFKVLTTKGLLGHRHRRGTFVRTRDNWNLLDSDVLRWQLVGGVSNDFFADMLELRRSIEPAAASLAAAQRTDEDLAALDAALDAMRASEDDPVLAVRADASFHTALLAASHNRFFAQLRRVIIPVLVERDRRVHLAGRIENPVAVHAAVVDRIREEDLDGAYMATLELLDVAMRHHP